MTSPFYKIGAISKIFLCLLMAQPSFAQYSMVSESQVGQLCSAPYACGGEERDRDTRQAIPFDQPIATVAADGKCGKLPLSESYKATIKDLSCSSTGGNDVQVRERTVHSDEKLDESFRQMRAGNDSAAQKALLTDLSFKQKFPFRVTENWNYLVRRGAYTDCRGSKHYESGGEEETYQTTCYRQDRYERVIQRVIQKRRYCRVATPPPPPPPPEPEPTPVPDYQPSYPSPTYPSPAPEPYRPAPSPAPYRPSPSPSPAPYKPSPSPSPAPYRPSPSPAPYRPAPAPAPAPPTAPRGNGEDSNSRRDRIRRGREEGSIQQLFKFNRTIAQNTGNRRIDPDIRPTLQDSTPTYGCDQWDTMVEIDEDRYVDIRVPGFAYSCTRTRNKWCTWLEEKPAAQACPEEKNAVVDVKFMHDPAWKPGNPNYDKQLPNKFDLLLGESEYVKIGFNSDGRNQTATAQIENAVKGRTKAWNTYDIKNLQGSQACAYKDQLHKIEVHTQGRIVQPAPNPIEIPKDPQTGEETPFLKFDEKGRPSLMALLNPGRSMVLDRSEISRMFGADAKVTASKSDKTKSGAIETKFWENTLFWMRLFWYDGSVKVRVSQAVKFNVNMARPVGDEMQIALDGSEEVRKLYRLSFPFEETFGNWFEKDVPLDPNRDYYLEIKLAQPGFKGIYDTGFKDAAVAADGQVTEVEDKNSYSESKILKFRAPEAKRDWIDRWWHWREKRMWRKK